MLDIFSFPPSFFKFPLNLKEQLRRASHRVFFRFVESPPCESMDDYQLNLISYIRQIYYICTWPLSAFLGLMFSQSEVWPVPFVEQKWDWNDLGSLNKDIKDSIWPWSTRLLNRNKTRHVHKNAPSWPVHPHSTLNFTVSCPPFSYCQLSLSLFLSLSSACLLSRWPAGRSKRLCLESLSFSLWERSFHIANGYRKGTVSF